MVGLPTTNPPKQLYQEWPAFMEVPFVPSEDKCEEVTLEQPLGPPRGYNFIVLETN